MEFNLADMNLQGSVYTACNQAAKLVTLINTSTVTGFVLSNPWGSGQKLVLMQARFAHTTVPTATSIVFLAMSIAPASVAMATGTAITVYKSDGSGAITKNAGRAYSAVTTPNLPAYTQQIGYAPTDPSVSATVTWRLYSNGGLVLVPGTYVQISYLGQAPTGIADMTWAEVPVLQ
jgi:hypothetical protein